MDFTAKPLALLIDASRPDRWIIFVMLHFLLSLPSCPVSEVQSQFVSLPVTRCISYKAGRVTMWKTRMRLWVEMERLCYVCMLSMETFLTWSKPVKPKRSTRIPLNKAKTCVFLDPQSYPKVVHKVNTCIRPRGGNWTSRQDDHQIRNS